MNPHEEGVALFFVQKYRARWRAAIAAGGKRRARELERLNHNDYCDDRFATPADHRPDVVYAELKRRGAPDRCHVIGGGELDGQELELLSALSEVESSGYGAILSCLPGRLAYFEGEVAERFILQRSD